MSVAAGFMVPHPPMIIPDVGRGDEEQIRDTIRAYERVADEIAALRPDTIIFASPHAVMYSDYFHISPGAGAEGSFRRFRAPQVRFHETYDTELVQRICQLADVAAFPAGVLGEKDSSLDHGTMVPLWFIRKKYQGGRIVRLGLSGLPLTEHYKLGQIIRQAIDELGRNAVFVASGDLSHKLQSYGPYGFAPEGPEYDRRIMDVCGRGAFGELFDFDETFCDKAAECGHRSFVIMAGTFDGLNVQAEQLSHQDVTGVGYGICTFYPGDKNEERFFLQSYLEEKHKDVERGRALADAYVRLAYVTVEAYVRNRKMPSLPKDLPQEMLNRQAGVFVSIHAFDRLRGCIGTIGPATDNIAHEIMQNAVSAASRDPRFSPITEEELPYLEISVDVLGEPEPISSIAELDVKRYGVIVTSGRKRGLLLPDLDGVDTPEQQVGIAARKGGIRDDEKKSLQRFEVIRHH